VCGGVGCCRVGSLLTFDIPQTALVATLDTYDFNDFYFLEFFLKIFFLGASPGSAGCFKKPKNRPKYPMHMLDIPFHSKFTTELQKTCRNQTLQLL
jgi:hypothetical protein